MKNASTISRGDTFEAALTKGRADRAAAEQRIASQEATRAQLLEGDDLEGVDKLDQVISADRRLLAIIDQRLKVISRNIRREEHDRREAQRAAAIKKISAQLEKRNELVAELEVALKRVVELYNKIKDEKQLRSSWSFGVPERFSWCIYDFGRECLRFLRDDASGYDLIPAPIRGVLGHSSGTGGYTEVLPPSGPTGLVGQFRANASLIVDSLRKIAIHPKPEPLADDMEAA